MENDTNDILQEILHNKRFGAIIPYTKKVADFVLNNHFDKKTILTEKYYPHPQVAIAVQRRIKDVISEKILDEKVIPIEYVTNLLHYYSEIKELPVVIAIAHTRELIISKESFPEGDAILGLLFGYKPCDIKYYIQTRVLHLPHHAFEIKLDEAIGSRPRTIKEQIVMCEACTRSYLKEITKTKLSKE